MKPTRVAVVAVALTLALSGATEARAQRPAVQLYQPAPTADAVLGTHTSRPLPHLTLFAGLSLHYANEELVGVVDDDTVFRPIAHRTQGELAVAFGLWRRLEVALALPVVFSQSSRAYPQEGVGDTAAGLGDLRILVKGIALHNERYAGFGLAGVLELSAPTGRTSWGMGEQSATFTPRLVLDWRHRGGAVVALNIGYHVRKGETFEDLVVNDELRFALGTEVPLQVYGLSLLGELTAAMGLSRSPDGTRIESRKSPVEALFGARWRHRAGWIVTAGAGVGLSDGYGAPDVRALVSVGYRVGFDRSRGSSAGATQPRTTPRPVARRAPTKPGRPATPPPPGADDFDRSARADPDADGDGVPTPLDRCPTRPEDVDGFQDGDGCPDPDNDQDGVPDQHDKCPTQKETVNGVKDDDGCPDKGRSRVTITRRKIQILDKIFFETGSDRIKPVSYPILNQVAGVLKANWWITRVRIEGHTDNRGDKEMNVDLSVRRAYRVRAYLVRRGVDAHRLLAKGFGPKRPIASNRWPKTRAKNRRVEFVIVSTQKRGGAK